MNITVIFTGGTIGSRDNAGIISVDQNGQYRLVDMYRSSEANDPSVSFVTAEPYTILSEQLNGQHLEKLVRCVGSALLEDKCDGVIVTHGSDTLQYSAAILECVFGMSEKPVVLVASNYVLDDSRANGLSNFIGAIELIKNKTEFSGVYVSYKNPGESLSYLRGDRVLLPWTYSDKMYSYDAVDNQPYVFDIEPRDFKLTKKCNQVMQMKVYPGMTFAEIDYRNVDNEIKVILLEGYHSGTMPMDEDFKRFVEKAKQNGCLVYLLGLSGLNSHYETVEEYEEIKIIPLLDELPVNAYCKAWIALSNNIDICEVFSD